MLLLLPGVSAALLVLVLVLLRQQRQLSPHKQQQRCLTDNRSSFARSCLMYVY